jgi:hypothetical protein
MRFIYIVMMVVGLFLLTSHVTYSAELTSPITVQGPDTRIDGTVLESSEISEFRFFVGVDEAVDITSTEYLSVIPGTDITYHINLEPRPSQPYTLQFAGVVVDSDGRQSASSNVVERSFEIVSTAVPSPMSIVDVTINCDDDCEITEVTE